MGWPSYLCGVLFARAPVLGLCFFVSVKAKTELGLLRFEVARLAVAGLRC